MDFGVGRTKSELVVESELDAVKIVRRARCSGRARCLRASKAEESTDPKSSSGAGVTGHGQCSQQNAAPTGLAAAETPARIQGKNGAPPSFMFKPGRDLWEWTPEEEEGRLVLEPEGSPM